MIRLRFGICNGCYAFTNIYGRSSFLCEDCYIKRYDKKTVDRLKCLYESNEWRLIDRKRGSFFRGLGHSEIVVVPKSVWNYVGIKEVVYHHGNDFLVMVVPKCMHKTFQVGKSGWLSAVQHRIVVENCFLSIGIDIKSIFNGFAVHV